MSDSPQIYPIPDAWPCQIIEERDRNDMHCWTEISEEHYWYFLEVLPPIYVPGGFQVSEPWRDNLHGYPLYLTVATIRERHYARHLATRDAGDAIAQLRAQLDAPTCGPRCSGEGEGPPGDCDATERLPPIRHPGD